ncbi:meiosis-specific MEI4 [Solea senegalensis]|uniref:Meiosis-specific MEI4 n=1 Tax=Solea senegalensis TaxID=28829 RepID=A0AAV6RW84_SOLSE|nr:meiosis-specific protein MEI4 [Solea senegalensis]KAG7508933.1 meiosis-specific MEI4 [Solea senegalensis]
MTMTAEENDAAHLAGTRSQVSWFFTQVRVALAVAIIKTKPAGMSGRKHAEAVACKLKRQDERWRERAQELQQEVLRLRQELLITRVTSTAESNTEAAGDDDDNAVVDASLDGFASSNPPADCDYDSATPDLLLPDSQPAAPSSHQHHLLPPQEAALCPHVHFLHSLCSLHRVARTSRGLEALWFGPDGGAGSVLADSVCQLLESVVAACGAPPPLGPGDLVQQACAVAARALDVFCRHSLPSAEFRRRVEESLREMTTILLRGRQPGELQTAETLREHLVTLGNSNMSKSFLIGHILSQISAVADQLWQLLQGQQSGGLDTFPLDQYQNCCHLLWVAEQLLQTSSAGVDVASERTVFLRHLERRVFLLSDEFPLFSVYMWRVGRLLTSSET